MDCRVKPGNDESRFWCEHYARLSEMTGTSPATTKTENGR